MKVLDGRRMASALLFFALSAFLAAALALSPQPALAAQQEERPLLMIVVGFEGGGEPAPYNNVYDWSEALFSGEESLAAYYRDQSKGLLSLIPANETSEFEKKQNTNRADQPDDGVVHVKLDSNHHDWSLVNEDVIVKKDFDQAVANSFDAARAFVDFDAYDKNDDGRITSDELIVVVCTSGYDASGLNQAKRSDLPLLWPHSGTIDNSVDEQNNADALPSAYIAIAENFVRKGEDSSEAQREPIGIIAHELGHCLGLPDLYPLNDASEQGEWAAYKVGNLSLMAKGAWAQALDDQHGWIFRPTSLDPWSLTELGWCNPLVAEREGDYHLYSRSSDMGYNTLLIPTADPNQYFLLENRQPESWDAALENASANGGSHGGVVIWHIDAGIFGRFRADNQINDTNHRPGVMPLFFEVDKSGAYTLDSSQGTPDLTEPFFSSRSIERNLGSPSSIIELPLYGEGKMDSPAQRSFSGITLQIMSESGPDMIVRVKLAGDTEVTSSRSSWKPPTTLFAILVAILIIGASALAVNVARKR